MEGCTERAENNQVTDDCLALLKIRSHLDHLTTILSNFTVSPLTFVSVEKQDELLLN